jgi:hypothetical protein
MINGSWIGKPSPKSRHIGKGNWFGELNKAWSDGDYAVMSRKVQTDWGEIDHVCIRNTSSTDIPWKDKQRIKNELFGHEQIAVEVFPPHSELVDDAYMYHLWVLPKGFKLPFNLFDKKEQENGR